MPFDLDLSLALPLLNRVKRTFSPSVASEILLVAGRKVGVAAEALVPPYPNATHKPLALYYDRVSVKGVPFKSKFKTLKQQRAVFALIQKGKIPSRRTGQLGRSITSQAVEVSIGVVLVRVGSNLSYAPYVIDAVRMSHYHRGNWIPLQTDIQRGMPQLRRVAVNAVTQEAQRRLNNG